MPKKQKEEVKDPTVAIVAHVKSQLNEFDGRAWLKETCIYIVWLLAFTLTIFATRTKVNQFNYVDLWRNKVQSGISDKFSVQGDFWNMITASIIPILGPAPSISNCTDMPDACNATYSFPSDEGDFGWSYAYQAQNGNETTEKFRLGNTGNVLVDGIWIRQLRVKSINCSQFGKFSDPSMPCFPDWSRWSDVEEKVYTKLSDFQYGVDQGPEFVYVDEKNSKFPSKSGYHGGGFVFNFDNPDTAEALLSDLQSRRWIDLKTRAIFTSICVYNMNNNIFLCCNLLVEVDSLGKHSIQQSYFVVTLNSYDMKKFSTLLKLGLQGVVGALVVYYTIEELREMKNQGLRQYFGGSFWNTFDVINLLLFMLSGYFQYQSVMLTYGMNSDASTITTAKLMATGDYTERNNIINAINGLLMWMKIFKYLSITKRLLRISNALKNATSDIGAFMFVMSVVFVAFSVSGFLIFGVDVRGFSTMGNTFLKLYRVMLGDWDYTEFVGSAPILGPIYFILYVVLTMIVLLNFIVGVLANSYNNVVEEEEEAVEKGEVNIDVLDLLVHKGKEKIGIPVDLHALAGLEERLAAADQDGDGLVDLSELDTLLGGDAASMFPGKSPQEILKMFDADGSGKLDAKEILVSSIQDQNCNNA